MSRVFGSDGHGENWQKIIQQKIATLLARADTCIESDEKKNRRKKWTWPTWVTSQESFAPGENLLSPLPLPQHYGHTSSILRDSYWSAEEDHARPVMDDGLKWRLVFLFSSQSIDELLHLRQHLMWVDGNMDHLCVFVWWRSCRTAAIIQCWTA